MFWKKEEVIEVAEDEEDLTCYEKIKLFIVIHWRGIVIFVFPLILIAVLVPFPPKPYQWCGYTLLLMAIFWVSECIPVAITSFLPVVIFPMAGVMTTTDTCKAYVNDTILMFVESIILAYSIEQSGLHKRLAYCAIRVIGYSHVRLLLAMSIVTTFCSLWVTNTAATTMMVPINFAVLNVFDKQKILVMYEVGHDGQKIASDITTCYFCAASFSATIGGIGTLVGTATNLAFKGLFQTMYPAAPEYLSFPQFSAFAIPYMILLEVCLYFYMIIVYFGVFRPESVAAKQAKITKAGVEAAQKAIQEDSAKMGKFSCWEGMVLFLFTFAMVGFFSRSPQMFPGWADLIQESLGIEDPKYIRDSALAAFVAVLMFILPSSLKLFRNFTAKTYDQLPKSKVLSVLDWQKLNEIMPFSFMFLLVRRSWRQLPVLFVMLASFALTISTVHNNPQPSRTKWMGILCGGFALSDAARITGLNDKVGESMRALKDLPNLLIILLLTVVVIIITNFGSNVAVANVMCPLAMQMAKETDRNPLWYCLVAGFCSSYCFMIPVGTPGNLIVQSAVHIPTRKMIVAGAGPTLTTIILTFLAMAFYAPIIWPDLTTVPAWVNTPLTETYKEKQYPRVKYIK